MKELKFKGKIDKKKYKVDQKIKEKLDVIDNILTNNNINNFETFADNEKGEKIKILYSK